MSGICLVRHMISTVSAFTLRENHGHQIRSPIDVKPRLAPVEAIAPSNLGLSVRPRRNRKTDWSRRMVRENVLTADDLICPSSSSMAARRARRFLRCLA